MNLYSLLKRLDHALNDWPKAWKRLRRMDDRLQEVHQRLHSLETQMAQDKHWKLIDRETPTAFGKQQSSLCKQADFLHPSFSLWCARMKEPEAFHRKLWEFVFILQALSERGLLEPGRKGLGFAVGTEPLPAVMTTFGCQITATDLDADSGESQGWNNGNQLCRQLEDLNQRGIADAKDFAERCSFRPVDMNAIPDDLRDFDFTWSACSFEHLGSIEKGLAFLKEQMKTLKPGGWAVHTTEFNISSNTDTLETEHCVIFRQRDIESIAAELRSAGHHVEEFDFSLGWHPFDYKVDVPPYTQNPHLRLQLDRYVCTSIGLIVQKGM